MLSEVRPKKMEKLDRAQNTQETEGCSFDQNVTRSTSRAASLGFSVGHKRKEFYQISKFLRNHATLKPQKLPQHLT